MEQISIDQFDKVLPLFDFDFPNRSWCLAFAEGQTLGAAFVDNVTDPAACLITLGWHNVTFIGGQPEQEWLNRAFAQLRRDQYLYLMWADWAANRVTPPPGHTEVIERYEFPDWPPPHNQAELIAQLPQDHHFRKMDQELFMRCEEKDEILTAYGTPENFLSYGFGFCLMHQNEICCEVSALFRAAGRYEMNVLTPEKYRRRGYAQMTCAYVVAECIKNGYQPIWSCHQENVASAALARKLGYRTEREYQFLYYAQNE